MISKYQSLSCFVLTICFVSGICCSEEDIFSQIEKGDDDERIRQLFQQSPDLLTKTDDKGETPLMRAAWCGRVKVVRALIGYKVELDTRSLRGQTALHHAAARGHEDIVKLLVDNGAGFYSDQDLNFPSHYAIHQGYPRIALLLLNSPSTGFDIWLAAYADRLDLAKSLLESAPKSINQLKGGLTPLHYAVTGFGNAEMVRYLIEKGAKIDVPVPKGTTILNAAIQRGSLPVVKELIKAGVNLNDKVEPPPLYTAIRNHQHDIAKLLLENHCDPNQACFEQRLTPLFSACFQNDLTSVKLLIANGAKVDLVCNKIGDTPLMIAVVKDNLGMFEYLLDKGADIKIKNSLGETALHIYARSARGDSPRCGEKLVTLIDVNSVDGAGNTPLINAVRADCPGMVKCLLKAKANPLIASPDGLTPLVLAQQLGNEDVLQLLKSDQK